MSRYFQELMAKKRRKTRLWRNLDNLQLIKKINMILFRTLYHQWED